MNHLDEAKSLLPTTLRKVQKKIRWRKGSASRHLLKRINLGHLTENSSIQEYHNVIYSIVNEKSADVYLYHYKEKYYPTIVSQINMQTWLVMITPEAIMETCFVIEFPQQYLIDPRFIRIGRLGEVLNE